MENDFYATIERIIKAECGVKDSIRQIVAKLEQNSRKMEQKFQQIHRNCDASIAVEVKEMFCQVRTSYSELSALVKPDEYFRYLSMWQNITAKLCYLACFVVYLESGKLASKEFVAEILGISAEAKTGFHIALEDYLCGILFLATELSRWCMNCVTNGNNKTPFEIFYFLGQIETGFKLLNLKNDFLRKRYDGLKYDIKRVEQVVYDLEIRGLKPS